MARNQSYMTRAMRSSDPRYASILGKLGYSTRQMVAAPTVSAPKAEPEEDMTALRQEYERVVGKRAFHGWDADELRRRMAEARDQD